MLTGTVCAGLHHSKTGNGFMVFCRGKMRWFVVVIDASDTTCILAGSEGGLIFDGSGESVGGFVFEGSDETESGWIFGDAGKSLQ